MTPNVLVLAQEGTDTQPMPVKARLGFHSVFHRLWKVAIPTSLERNALTVPRLSRPCKRFFPKKLGLFLEGILFIYVTVVYILNPETDLKGITLFCRAITDSGSGAGSESPGAPGKVTTGALICAVFVGLTELKRVLTAAASSGEPGLWSVQVDSGINEGF